MRKALLFCGWCWCASSPLMYTIQRYAKYAHFGLTKNFPYLTTPHLSEDGKLTFDSSPNARFILEKHIEGTWETFKCYEPSSHRMNLREDLEPLKDFSLDHLRKLQTCVPTISNYLDFYIALHDHVITKGYKSVGLCGYKALYKGISALKKKGHDCAERYNRYQKDLGISELGEFVITEFQKELLSKFEVKCLFITRDPVRRAFGQYMNAIERVTSQFTPEGQQANYRYKLPYEFNVINYLDDIDYCCEIYGKENVHMTVMEELWEDDGTARKKLSEFLGHPIDKLWKNLYAPDRGHLVKYDKDVPCQANGQDLYELTPEMYYEFKKKYQHFYDSWEERYGSLPLYWGKPINYLTGKP